MFGTRTCPARGIPKKDTCTGAPRSTRQGIGAALEYFRYLKEGNLVVKPQRVEVFKGKQIEVYGLPMSQIEGDGLPPYSEKEGGTPMSSSQSFLWAGGRISKRNAALSVMGASYRSIQVLSR